MSDVVNRLMDKYLERGKRIAELEALLKAQPRTINTEKLNPCCPTCGADPERLTDRIAELEVTIKRVERLLPFTSLCCQTVVRYAAIKRALGEST